MTAFEEWIAKTKRIRYSIGVLLLPWLFTGLIDGRGWITVTWWVVGFGVIWLPFLLRRRQSVE